MGSYTLFLKKYSLVSNLAQMESKGHATPTIELAWSSLCTSPQSETTNHNKQFLLLD